MLRRRSFVMLPGASLGTSLWPRPAHAKAPSAAWQTPLQAALKAIERDSGGRLGVLILDTATGAEVGLRADQRFPMCSTFKLLAAALVLWRVDRGLAALDQRIHYSAADLTGWSPVTRARLADGAMRLDELCEATLTRSDNTAANLILAHHGGPAGLTSFVRAMGDTVTRLDRNEPTLNRWQPGELRDTTSPRAMLHSLQRIVLGRALKPASREQMQRWLVTNTTGSARLRAHLPTDWRVGDKTGTGNGGITNDVAVVWPPGRAPLLVTAYLAQSQASSDTCEAALASVGRLLTQMV